MSALQNFAWINMLKSREMEAEVDDNYLGSLLIWWGFGPSKGAVSVQKALQGFKTKAEKCLKNYVCHVLLACFVK